MTGSARVLLVVALVAAAFFGYRWWNSPERQIRRVLDDIAERVSHDQPLAGLAAVTSLAGLQEHFALDVTIEPGTPLPPLAGRDAVLAAAARVASATPALRLEFTDERIAVGADGTSAEVACSVSATVRDQEGRETVDAREVAIDMRLVDRRWVVQRVRSVDVIEPVT